MNANGETFEKMALYSAALPFQRKGFLVESAGPSDRGVDFFVKDEASGVPVLAVEVKYMKQRSATELKRVWRQAHDWIGSVKPPILLIVMTGLDNQLLYSWLRAEHSIHGQKAEPSEFKKLSGGAVDEIVHKARAS